MIKVSDKKSSCLLILIMAISRITFSQEIDCNRTVYGTSKYIEGLPQEICIPKRYVIDDYVRYTDLDANGKVDYFVVKYNKKQEDQIDGDTTFWRFYDTTQTGLNFKMTRELKSLTPPFCKDYSWEYLAEHPIAEAIFNHYPLRMNRNSSAFVLRQDTIFLSYKADDTYGKTFVFKFNSTTRDWPLEEVWYFIGELPPYWWRENDFYFSLSQDIKVIEKRKPKHRISIFNFNLIDAFKYRSVETDHLAMFHIDKIEIGHASSIKEYRFLACNVAFLPQAWKY